MIVLDRGIMIIVIILALVNILLAALNIEILSIIIKELILHNLHRYITLMLDPLANHLRLPDLTNILLSL